MIIIITIFFYLFHYGAIKYEIWSIPVGYITIAIIIAYGGNSSNYAYIYLDYHHFNSKISR